MGLNFMGGTDWRHKTAGERILTVVLPIGLLGLGIGLGILLSKQNLRSKQVETPRVSLVPSSGTSNAPQPSDKPSTEAGGNGQVQATGAQATGTLTSPTTGNKAVFHLAPVYSQEIDRVIQRRLKALKQPALKQDQDLMANQMYLSAIMERRDSTGIHGVRSIRAGKYYKNFRPLSDAFIGGLGQYRFDERQIVNALDMLSFKGAKRYACVIYQGESDYGLYLAVFDDKPLPGETTEPTKPSAKQTAKP